MRTGKGLPPKVPSSPDTQHRPKARYEALAYQKREHRFKGAQSRVKPVAEA